MSEKEYEFGQSTRQRRRGPHHPGVPGEKAKDFSGTSRKILGYGKRFVPAVIIALICAVASTVLTLIGPDKLSELTEEITKGIMSGIDMDAVAKIGITLICFYAVSYIASALQGWLMATVTQKLSKQMRSDISQKINRLPMWYYNQTTTGDILSRVTNDVDTVGQSLNQSIGNLVSAVVLFVGSLFMMLKTNGILTLTAVLSTQIGFALMFVIMGRSQKYFLRQQQHLGEINGHIEEIYAGHTVVKAYNGEAQEQAKFDALNEKLRDSGFKAQCLSGMMMPIMGL